MYKETKVSVYKTSSILKYFIKKKKKKRKRKKTQKKQKLFAIFPSPPRFKDIATTGSGGHSSPGTVRCTYRDVVHTSHLRRYCQKLTSLPSGNTKFAGWYRGDVQVVHDFYSAQSLRTRDKVFKYFLFLPTPFPPTDSIHRTSPLFLSHTRPHEHSSNVVCWSNVFTQVCFLSFFLSFFLSCFVFARPFFFFFLVLLGFNTEF